MADKNLNITRDEMLAELETIYNALPRLAEDEITAQMLAERMGWTFQRAQGFLKSQGYKSRIVLDDNDNELMAYRKE